jgi:hypothetical protein
MKLLEGLVIALGLTNSGVRSRTDGGMRTRLPNFLPTSSSCLVLTMKPTTPLLVATELEKQEADPEKLKIVYRRRIEKYTLEKISTAEALADDTAAALLPSSTSSLLKQYP